MADNKLLLISIFIFLLATRFTRRYPQQAKRELVHEKADNRFLSLHLWRSYITLPFVIWVFLLYLCLFVPFAVMRALWNMYQKEGCFWKEWICRGREISYERAVTNREPLSGASFSRYIMLKVPFLKKKLICAPSYRFHGKRLACVIFGMCSNWWLRVTKLAFLPSICRYISFFVSSSLRLLDNVCPSCKDHLAFYDRCEADIWFALISNDGPS